MNKIIEIGKARAKRDFMENYKKFTERADAGDTRFIHFTDQAIQCIYEIEGYNDVENTTNDFLIRALSTIQEEYLVKYGICGESLDDAWLSLGNQQKIKEVGKELDRLDEEMIKKVQELEELISKRKELVGI